MTVPTQTNKAIFTANGVTTEFPFTFGTLPTGDLVVTLIDGETETVVSPSEYTVRGAGRDDGGSVVFNDPPASGLTVLIQRLVPYTQPTDYKNQGSFYPRTHERSFDRATMQVQQLAEQVERTIRLPPTSYGSGQLPPLVPLSPIVVNEDGSGLVMGDLSLSGDLLLRGSLAEALPGRGSDLVAMQDSLAPHYLKTVSDMINGLPVSVQRFINPLQLAAIRDGTSTYDASADLNDALASYSNLTVPAGRYMVGASLMLRDRNTLTGEGWSAPMVGSSVQTPRGSVFRLLPGANCDVFRQADKSYRQSFHLRGFAIDGDGSNQTSAPTPDPEYGMYQFNRNAFFLEAAYNTVLEDIMWFNMRGAGLAMHGDPTSKITNLFLKHCHGYNARTYNIYTEGAVTDVRIENGDYGFGRIANARLGSSFTVNGVVFWTSQCQDPTDPNTHINGTGAVSANGAGILIAGNNTRFNAGRSEGNAGHGMRIAGDNNTISDTVFYFNSATAATSGTYSGIRIDSGSDNNTIEAVEIRQSDSSTIALNMAIDVAAGATGTRIFGCGNIKRINANAVERVGRVVDGLKDGDRSDFAWSNTILDVYQNVANSMGSTFAPVSFQVENVDNRNAWGGAVFTAPEYGNYRISTGVGFSAADANNVQLSVFINGAEYRRLGSQRAGGAGSVILGGTVVLGLNRGDTVEIRGFASPTCNTVVGQAVTWLKINQVMS